MNPLDARRRLLGRNVYKKTVDGNPAIAQGSLARRYPGITMQGWTEQAQYEGKNLFDFKALTIPNDRTIIYNPIYLGDGTFTLSTDFKDSSGAFALYLLSGNVQEGATSTNGVDRSASKTVVSSEGYVTVAYRRAADLSNPLESNIMLNSGSTPLPYEPYTGGQPSPNPDYPQEIVSAGNYDEGSGKYQYTIKISDSEESPTKSQTVTLTSDRPLTKWDKLEKRNGQLGWVYKSAEVVLDGSEGYITPTSQYKGGVTSGAYVNNNDMVVKPSGVEVRGYCKRLRWVPGVWTNDGAVGFVYNQNQIHIRLKNSDTGVTAEDTLIDVANKIKSYVAQQYEEGNPFVFWYETTEEAFVPLSEAEQEQMNELYTFRPTTVLSNDCNCNMTLTYKTKKSLEVTA